MKRISLALAVAVLATPAVAQGSFADEAAVVPHAEFARRFLEPRGLGDASPEDVDLEALLREEYVGLDLGLYDLRFPREDLGDEDSAADFKEVVLALLESQERFHDWVEPQRGRAKDAASDVKTLRKWIEDWKPGRMGSAASAEDLVGGLGASERATAAAARFAGWMRSGGPIGLDREAGRSSRLLLIPTRPRFLELVCFAGWYYPHLESVFWDAGLGTWLGCRVQETQVLALMFASPEIDEGDFETGLPLDYKNETVHQQHAVHFGMQALFDNYYGDTIPPYLSTGLAMNMVIEQFGEVDTRIEGDLRARFTDAFSVFVPGGNSAGGMLPPMNPDGRWRIHKGRGHFVDLLRVAQGEGADRIKNSREKYLHFELENDDRNEHTTVRAPFLGSATEVKELPHGEYLGDYQEFFRAYKSGFAHWLRSAAAGTRKACETTFAELLVRLPDVQADGFEPLLTEVYGAQLSGPSPDRDTIEGRFLAWLSKKN